MRSALTRLTKMSSSELSLRLQVLEVDAELARAAAAGSAMPVSLALRVEGVDQLAAVGGRARAAGRRAPPGSPSSGCCSCSVSCFLPSLRISTCLVLDQDELALVDHADAVGHLLGLLDVVRGQDDGDAALAQRAHHLPHVAAQLDVDAGGGLVEEQDLRLVRRAPWRSARAASCRPTAS